VAYAAAYCIQRSMAQFCWPSAIIGEDYGGRFGGLVLHVFHAGTGEERINCPTTVVIDDELEMPLELQGFLSLVHYHKSNYGIFYSGPTIQRALTGRDPKQAGDAIMATKLPNLLIQSRFAHHLKTMLRSLIGSGMTPKQIEKYLQDWANDYVLLNPDESGDEAKAQRPFKQILIEIKDCPGLPGHLDATVTLQPHFKCASFAVKLLIVADTGDTDDD
jgi:type VI secretion system ImpC/EvpB family protein